MKIFSPEQIREADKYTIENEPILSLNLMERAAKNCFWKIIDKYSKEYSRFAIFVGPGNNGGDGLVIARLLLQASYSVRVFILNTNNTFSPDFSTNLKRFAAIKNASVTTLYQIDEFPYISKEELIIDALFGSGLSRPLAGFAAVLVKKINQTGSEILSIDIPSGLFGEENSTSNEAIIRANSTFTFELPFLSFFFPENEQYIGEFEIIKIGILPEFIVQTKTENYFTQKETVAAIFKSRKKFAHKGNFGHSLIIAGTYGKAGACILTAKSAHRVGAGLVSALVPQCNYSIMQISSPETMIIPDSNSLCIENLPDISGFNSIAIGPGIGFSEQTKSLLEKLISECEIPLVIDADAITIISENKNLLEKLPHNSILTPHPKEFERLFGKTENNFQRNKLQKELSEKYNIYIVLKGAFTCITTPLGESYFNSSGNPAMATAGSGDVLTGVISGLLAQNYSPFESCLLGVYLHGRAGDAAVENSGRYALIASDIINNLGVEIF